MEKNNYYVEPKDFHNEYNISILKDEPTYKLYEMVEKIASKYSNIWKNKIDRDACINFATCEALRKWKKYDIKRSENIFAFFTQMISNDMKTHYNKLKGKKNTVSIEALFTNRRDL